MKIALSLALLLLIIPTAYAESVTGEMRADIEKQRAMINDERNTVLAFNMSFTEEEREAFWPLYEKYRQAMKNVGTRRLEIIIDYSENFGSMTEDKASDLLRRSMESEKQALEVKHHYMQLFGEIMPPSKVARLYQIENRMDTAIDMKLSEEIPLME